MEAISALDLSRLLLNVKCDKLGVELEEEAADNLGA